MERVSNSETAGGRTGKTLPVHYQKFVAGRQVYEEPEEKGSDAGGQIFEGFLKQVHKLMRLSIRHCPVKVIKRDIHPVVKSQE